MKRTYLIDSENINDVWVELLQTLEDRDEILVFYTDKSAHMGYDKIVCLMEQKKGSVRWIKCFEGQNALDFQLVTELGSRISQDGKREYVIVSNDTGYDAVVRYWQQKECRVRRMKSTECGNVMVDEVQEAEPELPDDSFVSDAEEDEGLSFSSEDKTSEPEQAASWREQLFDIFDETGSSDPEDDLTFLEELCRNLKLSNMSLIHNILEFHFGQETGNAIYRFIKENPGCRGELSAGYSNNKKQRERQYLELVLKRSGVPMEEGDVDLILKIINAIPRKNLNGIHTALVRRFGQEDGSSFYAVLRNHVKIIRGL